MTAFWDLVEGVNGVIWADWVLYVLLAVGVLFTLWSGFGQYRALTHGVQVIRGRYDDKAHPGAINHFQALSAALSATVGLGNIAGVALAVALGGPGAILWMWVIGVVGMALKTTEVTQSMLYRDTTDPENPHGGPMFVLQKGLGEASRSNPMLCIVAGLAFAAVCVWAGLVSGSQTGLIVGSVIGLGLAVLGFANGAMLGSLLGGIFVITLLISAVTGGNMFQAWNVADITYTYFKVPQVATGILLTVAVGAVIIGGIKRIGSFAGRLVPFMCVMYLVAGLFVLVQNIDQIPAMLALIVRSGLPDWLGGANADPSGAFLGGTFGYAAMWGVKRALFSSEAGQGSAPIAHSAAKTDEPVREGVVAGLEPMVDTLIVCTITALVILSSGAYNRPAEAVYTQAPQVIAVEEFVYNNDKNEEVRIQGRVFSESAGTLEVMRTGTSGSDLVTIAPASLVSRSIVPNLWTIESYGLPPRTDDSKRILRRTTGSGWVQGDTVFMIVHADESTDTGRDLRRITGRVFGDEDTGFRVAWNTLQSVKEPFFIDVAEGETDLGIYGDYAGASLTAHAFDRVTPGLGQWLVSITVWLFALSTMISWSYYGEQGVYYLCAKFNQGTTTLMVTLYKVVYCGLIFLTTVFAMPYFGPNQTPLIGTDQELDMWTTMGLGVMLVANIPIMIVFGPKAMSAFHDYFRRMKSGQMEAPHAAPKFADVVEGKDVE